MNSRIYAKIKAMTGQKWEINPRCRPKRIVMNPQRTTSVKVYWDYDDKRHE